MFPWHKLKGSQQREDQSVVTPKYACLFVSFFFLPSSRFIHSTLEAQALVFPVHCG